MSERPPYLLGVRLVPERVSSFDEYPFNMRFVRDLDVSFERPVTFLVGENGSGKSTLIEAIAAVCRLPVAGGARADLAARHAPERESPLSQAIRPSFRQQPRDGYFLRAEFYAHFASLLDERRRDPDFRGDPYAAYGGRSLHTRSHGEAFLEIVQGRFRAGIYLLDEPESALSPQRQLVLLAHMHRMASTGKAQFIVATHSPILMTFPEAQLLSFDGPKLCSSCLEDTSHYQITRGILSNPESYWRHLVQDEPA